MTETAVHPAEPSATPREWHSRMTGEHDAAMQDWFGGGYAAIRDEYQSGGPLSPTAQAHAEAVSMAPAYPAGQPAYRGMRVAAEHPLYRALTIPGSRLQSVGPSSWAARTADAAGFAHRPTEGESPVVLHLGQGHPALRDVSSASMLDESEATLPHGQHVEVGDHWHGPDGTLHVGLSPTAPDEAHPSARLLSLSNDARLSSDPHDAFLSRLYADPDAHDAMKSWRQFGYRSIREAQREDTGDPRMSMHRHIKHARDLERAVSYAPLHDGEAYRGMALQETHPLYLALRAPGTVLEAAAHSSFSKRQAVGDEFSLKHAVGGFLPVVLRAAPWSSLHDVTALDRLSQGGQATALGSEDEVILPKGVRMRVGKSRERLVWHPDGKLYKPGLEVDLHPVAGEGTTGEGGAARLLSLGKLDGEYASHDAVTRAAHSSTFPQSVDDLKARYVVHPDSAAEISRLLRKHGWAKSQHFVGPEPAESAHRALTSAGFLLKHASEPITVGAKSTVQHSLYQGPVPESHPQGGPMVAHVKHEWHGSGKGKDDHSVTVVAYQLKDPSGKTPWQRIRKSFHWARDPEAGNREYPASTIGNTILRSATGESEDAWWHHPKTDRVVPTNDEEHGFMPAQAGKLLGLSLDDRRTLLHSHDRDDAGLEEGLGPMFHNGWTRIRDDGEHGGLRIDRHGWNRKDLQSTQDLVRDLQPSVKADRVHLHDSIHGFVKLSASMQDFLRADPRDMHDHLRAHGANVTRSLGKPDDSHEYSAVLVPLPEPLRQSILDLAALVPDDDLAQDEVGREGHPHVTLAYGLPSDANAAAVGLALEGAGPVSLRLGGLRLFRNDDADVLYREVLCDPEGWLADAHAWLEPLLTKPGAVDRPYVAHATIALLLPGHGQAVIAMLGQPEPTGPALAPEAELRGSDETAAATVALRSLSGWPPVSWPPVSEHSHGHAGDWVRGLDDEAKYALRSWVTDNEPHTRAQARGEAVDALDRALGAAPRLSEGTAHRGLALDSGHALVRALRQPGAILTTRAHTSWTTDEETAHDFAQDEAEDNGGVPIVLHMPVEGRFRDVRAANPGESEVVFPRGSRVRVESVKRHPVTGVTHVRLAHARDEHGPEHSVRLALRGFDAGDYDEVGPSTPGGRWAASLSPAHRRALKLWTGGGSRLIRDRQRGDVDPTDVTPDLDGHMVALESAVASAPRHAGEAYRGIVLPSDAASEHPLLTSLRMPGAVLGTSAHTSWSKDEGVAHSFARPSHREYAGVLLRVLPSAHSPLGDITGAHPREEEVVLPKGSRLRVVSHGVRQVPVYGGDPLTVHDVTVEHVPPDEPAVPHGPRTLSLEASSPRLSHDDWVSWVASSPPHERAFTEWVKGGYPRIKAAQSAHAEGQPLTDEALRFGEAIDRAPRYHGPWGGHRGLTLPRQDHPLVEALSRPGAVLRTGSDTSWSDRSEIAHRFTVRGSRGVGVVLSTNPRHVSHFADLTGVNPREGELVLPRGKAVRVASAEWLMPGRLLSAKLEPLSEEKAEETALEPVRLSLWDQFVFKIGYVAGTHPRVPRGVVDPEGRKPGQFAPKGSASAEPAGPEPATPPPQPGLQPAPELGGLAHGMVGGLLDMPRQASASLKQLGRTPWGQLEGGERLAHEWASDRLHDSYLRLPPGVRPIARGAWVAARTHTDGADKLLAATSRVKGLKPDQARMLRGAVSATLRPDLSELQGAPVGSAQYLLYSSSPDPMAGLRAARVAVAAESRLAQATATTKWLNVPIIKSLADDPSPSHTEWDHRLAEHPQSADLRAALKVWLNKWKPLKRVQEGDKKALSKPDAATHLKTLDDLNQALSIAPRHQSGEVLHGLTLNSRDALWKELHKPGAVLTGASHTSWTTEPRVAYWFSVPEYGPSKEHSVILHVSEPHRAMRALGGSNLVKTSESEVVLPKGSNLRTVRHEISKDGTLHAYLEPHYDDLPEGVNSVRLSFVPSLPWELHRGEGAQGNEGTPDAIAQALAHSGWSDAGLSALMVALDGAPDVATAIRVAGLAGDSLSAAAATAGRPYGGQAPPISPNIGYRPPAATRRAMSYPPAILSPTVLVAPAVAPHQAWWERLSGRHQLAVKHWVDDSSGIKEAQRLRLPDYHPQSGRAALLEEAVAAAPKSGHAPAWRGMVVSPEHPLWDALRKPGARLRTSSHTSWSDDRAIGHGFGLPDSPDEEHGVLLYLRSGHHGMRDLRGVNAAERELVLPKDHEVVVHRAQLDPGGMLHVTLLSGEGKVEGRSFEPVTLGLGTTSAGPHADWHDSVVNDPAMRAAMTVWKGTEYTGMRAAQREGRRHPCLEPFLRAVEAAPPVAEGQATHRGMDLPVSPTHPLLAALLTPGSVVEADSHSSWTKDPDVAYFFSTPGAAGPRARVVLHMHSSHPDMRDVSSWNLGERETILKRGARLRVLHPRGELDPSNPLHVTEVHVAPADEADPEPEPVRLGLFSMLARRPRLSLEARQWHDWLAAHPAHLGAVSDWTDKGYAPIKEAIRTGRDDHPYARQARRFEAALGVAPPHEGGTHRGIALHPSLPVHAALTTPGAVLATQSPTSWSHSERVAAVFSRPERLGQDRMVLSLRGGHPGMRDLSSMNDEEREAVLPTGHTVRVVSAERGRDGIWRIGLEPYEPDREDAVMPPRLLALGATDDPTAEWQRWLDAHDEHRRSVGEWATSFYHVIKRVQRGSPHEWDDRAYPHAREITRQFEEAVDRAPRHEGLAYRGLLLRTPEDVARHTTPGTTLELRNHDSYSKEIGVASSFGPAVEPGETQAVIHLSRHPEMRDISTVNPTELETVLPKGSWMRVVRTERDPDDPLRVHVHAEPVLEGNESVMRSLESPHMKLSHAIDQGREWVQALSPRERAGLYSWMRVVPPVKGLFAGVGHGHIRDAELGRPTHLKAADARDALYSALSHPNAPWLQSTLYRGLHDVPDHALERLKPGSEVSHDVVGSFSPFEHSAANFLDPDGDRNVLYEVQNGRGVSLGGAYDVKPFNRIPGESEVVMPKGARFRVISRKFIERPPSIMTGKSLRYHHVVLEQAAG